MKLSKPAMLGKAIKGHNIRSRPADGEQEGDAGESIPAKEAQSNTGTSPFSILILMFLILTASVRSITLSATPNRGQKTAEPRSRKRPGRRQRDRSATPTAPQRKR